MSTNPLLPRSSALPPLSPFTRAGGLLVATGMMLGAFGTHAMRARLSPEKLHAWNTAASYAIYNGLGLMVVGLHPRLAVHRFAGSVILSGALLFSGSIIGLILSPEYVTRILGPITPLGGMVMIVGYISLAF